MFDLLIRGGRVIDGAGNPWFHADVGVAGDRIAVVGPVSRAGRAHDRRRRSRRLSRLRRHAHALGHPAAREPGARGEGAPGRHARRHRPGRARVRAGHGRRAREAARPARELERRPARLRLELAIGGRVPRPLRRSGGDQRRLPRTARDGADDRDGHGRPGADRRRARRDEAPRPARGSTRAPSGSRRVSRTRPPCTRRTTSSSSCARSCAGPVATTRPITAATAAARSTLTAPVSRSSAAPASRSTTPTHISASR